VSEKKNIPKWVVVEKGARIHPSVVFVPYEDKKTIIGKRTKIDSGSIIYGGVDIGNDCVIGHNTVIRFNTKIGHHSTIANLCMLEGNTTIGDHTLIHSNNHIGQKTTIGNYVFIAPICVTTNDPKMYYYRKEYSQTGEHWKLLKGPVIKDGARIAVGVIIFPGVTIGKHSVLGAGAVITKNVPDYAIAYGIPAEIRGYVDPKKDVIVECKRDHF
jgi:acetyltransferase-like isoleucine patch superfamily enzyme